MADAPVDAAPPRLLISTSPRSTWLWADAHTAGRVREVLPDAQPARRGRDEVPHTFDVSIGVDALTACETLADHGFEFAWHPSQHALNRAERWITDLPGMTTGH